MNDIARYLRLTRRLFPIRLYCLVHFVVGKNIIPNQRKRLADYKRLLMRSILSCTGCKRYIVRVGPGPWFRWDGEERV